MQRLEKMRESYKVRRICWKNSRKLFFLALYYFLLRKLPSSTCPVLGKFCKWMRGACCRQIFKHCGVNVNIERNAFFSSGFELEIGDNSGIGVNCVVPPDIQIGNDVLMGPNLHILRRNHNYEDADVLIRSQKYGFDEKTIIGSDVWFGRDVLLTPGRTVKDGCVIAARTCLCKDFPEYSVIGGNPSRLIRRRSH